VAHPRTAAVGGAVESGLGAVELLVEQLRRLAGQVGDVGTAAVGELPAVRSTAADALHSLGTVLHAAPAPTAAVEMLAEEIGAKRALVRALQEQLEAFDRELALLERSLVPLQEWGRQWDRLQSAVLAPLRR
jgi:ABC-type transporter Mla subunit MlaD